MQQTGPALTPQILTRRLSDLNLGFDKTSLRLVIQLLVTTYQVWRRTKLSLDEFVSQVAEGLAEGEESAIKPDQVERFKSRLRSLLSLEETLGVTAKAHSVYIEHSHVFCTTRIMTDIRFIFADDPDEPPKDAVVLHELRVGYHESGEHRDFFVSLDAEDLARLKEQIERAERKAKTLAGVLSQAGIANLDVK